MKYYRITVDSDEQIREDPIGWLTVDSEGYHFTSLVHAKDRDTSKQTQLNRDIKRIYGITFPCTVFYIDQQRDKNGLRNSDEDNLLFVPRNNGTGSSDAKVAAYMRQRQRGKPNILELDEAEIWKIEHGKLVKTTVGEVFGKKKEDPREATYTVYRYKNYSRRSGVYAYAYSPKKDIIYVYFTGKKRGWYKYDKRSAPGYVIDEMIQRARKGWGLNRYINKHPDTYYWKGTY